MELTIASRQESTFLLAFYDKDKSEIITIMTGNIVVCNSLIDGIINNSE